MTPRRFRDLTREHADRLRRVASCVTSDHPSIVHEMKMLTCRYELGGVGGMKLTGRRRLFLKISESLHGSSDDSLMHRYRYRITAADGREVLSFHHHLGRPPHLHLGAGAGELFDPLYKAHIPTGPVDFGDVVRMLITDFDVQPRRADWDHVLETAAQPAG